jgi:hypothetical protein
MYTHKIIDNLSKMNFEEVLNRGRFNKLDDSELKALQAVGFYAFEEAKQKAAQIQSITNAVMQAVNNTKDGIYDASIDGYNVMCWLNGEAETIQTLLEMSEEAEGVNHKQAGYDKTDT